MPEQKSIKKNFSYNFLKTSMQIVFPLITFPYASRVLFPEGLGKVNFAVSIVSYFVILASLGISTYGIRECSKQRNNKLALSKVVKELWNINLVSTLVSYLLLLLSLVLIRHFDQYRILILICSFSIVFSTLGLEWLYAGLEEYKYIAIRSILFQFISLILLFALVKSKDDYLLYAGITVFSSVGSNIFNFIRSHSFIDFNYKGELQYRKHIRPIMTLFGMALTISIYTALDTTMVGFIKGDSEVGIYTAATKITKIVISLITSLNVVLLPRLSYYKSEGNDKEFSILLKKAFQLLLLISIPSTVGLYILSEPIVLLFSGSAYLPSIIVMKAMVPIVIFISTSNLIGIQLFMPIGKEKYTLISVMAGAVINFALNYFLIPLYGALGAGIATSIAEFIVVTIQICISRKFIDYVVFIKPITQYILSSLLMLLSLEFILGLHLASIYSLLICVPLGLSVYCITLYFMKNSIIRTISDKFLSRRSN